MSSPLPISHTCDCSVADRDPHSYVFEPPGSASGSVRNKYGSGSGSGSFYPQAKIVRKTLISSVLWLLYDFLSLKNDKNVPVFRTASESGSVFGSPGSASGSVPKCHGSATLHVSNYNYYFIQLLILYVNWLTADTNFKFSLLVAGLSSGWPPGWLQTLMEMFHIDFGKEIAFSETIYQCCGSVINWLEESVSVSGKT